MRARALYTAAALSGALIVASLAAGLLGTGPATPGQEAAIEPAAASAQPTTQDDGHDHEHDERANASTNGFADIELEPVRPRHEHALAPREGEIPTRAEASELPHQFEDFTVEGDGGLAQMDRQGYVTGAGTLEDPYVINGFRVTEDLTIKDTDKAIVIENSYIEGQLTLNFVGEDVYVHHNYVHDLRVNENVRRDGATTAGLLEHNEIAFIGQLRHFGGEFANNAIGPRPDDVISRYLSDTGPADLPDDIVWNFDGYHLGHVHNNTVLGRVDVKLHGHFHGSCSRCTPHDHAEPAGFPEDNERPDGGDPVSRHSYRFHTLDFENNRIRTPDTGIALRFYDEAHAGDDQTANSEPNAHLEDRHAHHQYVRVADNDLRDGSLVFDIVNARDEDRHRGLVQEALVHLAGNEVTLARPAGDPALQAAYLVHAADDLEFVAEDNRFTFEEDDEGSAVPPGYRWIARDDPGTATGFLFDEFAKTRATVTGTAGQGADYGVTTERVGEDNQVKLHDNEFNARREARHDA